MASLNFEHTQSQHAQQKFALMARLEQANVLDMSEGEFHRLVAEIEKSPLFKKLYREEKVIRYQRFPRTDIASNFLELREETVADEGSLDIESLLINKKHIVHLIQKIGLEKFKQYFLFNEPDVDVSYIARECDLEISEIQQINSLINEFSVLSEFYNPSASRPEQVMLYSKIASIEKRQDSFIIGYFSPSFARGKYSIDYEKFEELKKNGAFGDTDLKEAQRIIKKLELINIRKDTITQILQGIVEKQGLYFDSGNPKALLPFSQKELAKKLDVVPSSISRAIKGKILDTPWGEERPLKDFFPRPSMFKRRLILQLIESETSHLSDEGIKKRLETELGVSLSRRTVTRIRNELNIPAAWQRERNSTKRSEEA